VGDDAFDQLDGELAHRRVRGSHPPRQGLEDVRATLIRLEEHVDGALAGLAPG
jgi:hypothetical protein